MEFAGENSPASGIAACAICNAREVEWVHDLALELAQFRVYGKHHVWGSPNGACGRCHTLLVDKNVEALVRASPVATAVSAEGYEEQVRNRIRALVVADSGGTPVDATRPPGYRDLVEQGFVPLEQLTGDAALVAAWPLEHRRSVREPDDASPSEAMLSDGQHWFVRSPWASIPLASLIALIMSDADRASRDRYQGQGAGPISSGDQARRLAAVHGIFTCDEATLRRRLGR